MLDKKVFESDFLSNFENAVLFILRNTKTRADIINLRRVETPEIPEAALREAVLNAMIHRDYFISGRILIEIYEDKVKILNPGKLLFNPKDFGNVSILRNPILAGCLQRTEFIEKIGSGIKRIKKLFPSVRFNIDTDWFCIIFKRQKSIESIKSSEKSSEKILALIKQNPRISAREISEKIKLSSRAIEKQINNLKKEGLLERIGPDKGGYWRVIEK